MGDDLPVSAPALLLLPVQPLPATLVPTALNQQHIRHFSSHLSIAFYCFWYHAVYAVLLGPVRPPASTSVRLCVPRLLSSASPTNNTPYTTSSARFSTFRIVINALDNTVDSVVGRASVPPEVGFSAASLDPSNAPRNSSRASRKAKEADPNDPLLSRTSYSLPTTPFATTFDESMPQTKRRKTHLSVDGDEKAPSPPQEVPDTPDQKVIGFQAVNTMPAKDTRNGESDKPNGDTTEEHDFPKDCSTDHAVTSTTSNNGRRKSQSAKSQSSMHAFLEPQNRRKSLATEAELAEPMKDKPITKTSTLDASATQGNRRNRKSMPAKLNKAEDLENNVNESRASTPRPGRKAKATAQANAEALKLSTRKARTPKNPAALKPSKDQSNGAVGSAPESLPTGTRRRNRKSIKTQEGNAAPSQPAPRKRGRPSEADKSRDREMADSTLQSPDGAHSGNDTEMYGDGFGVDGQMDGPASPKSLANAARTSRRNRKPTMRAMESLESEKRYRRRRAADEQLLESARAQHPDLGVIAQRLFELAAEAVSPDFVATTDAKAQLTQLKEEYWAKKNQTASAETAVGSKPGEENVPIISKPAFSKKTQVSKPWADDGGWMHTGHVNEHGEEYLFVPEDFDLYRPNNTYNDKQLPEPPLRLRSREQAEKDRIFGFPPRIGERNIPQNGPIPFMYENVDEEMAKIKAREEARQQGIIVNRTLPAAEIRTLIAQHGRPISSSPKETPKPPVRRRRRRTQAVVAEDGTEIPPKRGRRRRQPATAPSTPAQAQEPESPDKKTMKIKLKFGKGIAASAVQNRDDHNDTNGADNPRKRGLSATGDSRVETPGLEDRSTKKRKLSISDVDNMAKPNTPTTAAPISISDMKIDDTPASSSTQRTDRSNGTPRGRPRRRAGASVVTELNHAKKGRRTSTRKGPATPSVSESHENSSTEQQATESFDAV